KPNDPEFGGRNTLQLAWASAGCLRTKGRATAMKVTTAASFTKTMPVLKFADSLMPMIRMVVTARMARNASRLKLAVAWGSAANWLAGRLNVVSGPQRPLTMTHLAPGTSQICGGRLIP